MSGLSPVIWAPLLAAVSVGAAWYFLVVRPERKLGSQLGAQLGTQLRPQLKAAARSTQSRMVLFINHPRVQPYLGLLTAGIIWIVGGRGGPAMAVLAVWYAGRTILRIRSRNRLAVEQERCALHAISTASRALRAGIPITGMLQILATEGEGEAGKAFQEIVQRDNLGEELPASVRGVLLTSPIPALRAFGLALLVQMEAGGNIADITDRLARSLIDRGRVRRRAKTIVAYGQTAANILAMTPVIAVTLMSMNVDGYSEFILNRPAGNAILGVSALMLALGLVSVQRICRIELAQSARAS